MSGCAGSEPYVLQVLGNSMNPEFEEGEVIVIEPGQCTEPGAFVVALHGGEYVFRQLLVDNQDLFLRALNEEYPILKIEDESQIKGRIISKSSGNGRRRKSYL